VTTPTIPTDADGLLDTLSDIKKVQAIAEGGAESWQKFAGGFRDAFEARDKGATTEQIQVEVQRGLADFFRKHEVENTRKLDYSPNGEGAKTRAESYNPNAPGAPLDKVFNSTAEYLAATWHGQTKQAPLAKLATIRNDYSSTIPADGGFTIPETLRSTLLQTSLEGAQIRPRAFVVPMESLRVPFPTLDSTTNAGSVHGGMIAYWTEESGQLTESQAKFGRIVLEAKKLTGYSEVPNELFTDSIISFAAFLEQKWPEAITFFEELAYYSGTGVGEPLGFLSAGNGALVSVTKETGQTADTIVWENIIKMYARMLPSSLEKAVWIANIETMPQLATMAQVVGTGGVPVWFTDGAKGMPMTLLGRPIIWTEKASALGDAGDISLVDLSYYLIGDRQQMIMQTSPHYKFQHDQTAVRIIQRVDGRPWLQSAITPAKGSSTLSPFVQIAARA
jgi:HK97 family phage major capsid protein